MPICLYCGCDLHRNQPILYFYLQQDQLCNACRNQLHPINHTITIEQLQVHGLYCFNEFYRSLILQYKECMDEVLADVFLSIFKEELRKKYRHCLFVPAPSSSQKMTLRGFDHVHLLFQNIGIKIQSCFIKTDDIKQAFQSKQNRASIGDKIELVTIPDLGKKVILIDDVCTTGSTLLAMHRLFLNQGIKAEACVVAIHPLLLPQNGKIRQIKSLYLDKK